MCYRKVNAGDIFPLFSFYSVFQIQVNLNRSSDLKSEMSPACGIKYTVGGWEEGVEKLINLKFL